MCLCVVLCLCYAYTYTPSGLGEPSRCVVYFVSLCTYIASSSYNEASEHTYGAEKEQDI